MNAQTEYERWRKLAPETGEIEPAEIEDRFSKYLSFGTGGLRGVMGAGCNRMNKYVVRRASAGVADTIAEKSRGVVIGYDSRNNSREFALEAALTFAARGVKAYLFDALRPTPMVSFAVRRLNAYAGVVVTASHNPKQYNGYKVYGPDGGQLANENADLALQAMDKIDPFEISPMDEREAIQKGLLQYLGEDIDAPYIEHALSIRPGAGEKCRDIKIVYTPLHGSGNIPVRRALRAAGFTEVTVVPEQELPDGDFSTVRSPNPEEHDAFEYAMRLGDEVKAEILIGTDPDCDRVGVMARDKGEWRVLTGNQMGCLLLDYMLGAKTWPDNAYAVKTIVTTRLADEIGRAAGIEIINTLTGFKFIGETIERKRLAGNPNFVLGFEESYGYLAGGYVRDKDAVIASTLIAEMAAEYKSRGETLFNRLNALYARHGWWSEGVMNVKVTSEAQRNEKMAGLRQSPLREIGGLKVIELTDYLPGAKGLPASDVLMYELAGGAWLCVRPSGTEPKLKLYFGVKGNSAAESEEISRRLMEASREIMG